MKAMDDETAASVLATVHYNGSWVDVARKARELFGMTPEEKAVIEVVNTCPLGMMPIWLDKLAHDLRKSSKPRKPKPRWTYSGGHGGLCLDGEAIMVIEPELGCRIAKLLNETDG